MKIGEILQNNDGKIIFSVKNILYNKPLPQATSSDNTLNSFFNSFSELIRMLSTVQKGNSQISNITNIVTNTIPLPEYNTDIDTTNNIQPIKAVSEVILEWQQALLERTKKKFDDIDYFSPTTLESYSRNIRSFVIPFLEEHPECDNICIFSEKDVDKILDMTACLETKRVILIALKLMFKFAIEKNYVAVNPIADKKQRTKNTKLAKKEYDFIEDENRPLWINCMINEIHSEEFSKTDAPLAFLFTLLHGSRPEETCGVRWKNIDFEQDDYHVQNAFKEVPIYDPETMKKIGYKHKDGPLKTPESYRHINLDTLAKRLLLEHKDKQQEKYKKLNRTWSENEYIFQSTTNEPFVPKVLSKNFARFIKRNNLKHMVLYGLRHSFATHCRNLGMKPEVLARLMGHTEYETTQKYYVHVSPKQRKEELQKVQRQDIENYLGAENKDLVHLQNKINEIQ